MDPQYNFVILLLRRNSGYWKFKQLDCPNTGEVILTQNIELWNKSFAIDYISVKHMLAENAATLYQPQKFSVIMNDRGNNLESCLGNIPLKRTLVYQMDEDDWVSPAFNELLQSLDPNKIVIFKPLHYINVGKRIGLHQVRNYMLSNCRVFPSVMCKPNTHKVPRLTQEFMEESVANGTIQDITSQLVPPCLKLTSIASLTVTVKVPLTREFIVQKITEDIVFMHAILTNGYKPLNSDEEYCVNILGQFYRPQLERYITIMEQLKL